MGVVLKVDGSQGQEVSQIIRLASDNEGADDWTFPFRTHRGRPRVLQKNQLLLNQIRIAPLT